MIYYNRNFKETAYDNKYNIAITKYQLFYNCNDKHEAANYYNDLLPIINFTIYCNKKYETIIYYNKDTIAIIWPKLFLSILCNLLQ